MIKVSEKMTEAVKKNEEVKKTEDKFTKAQLLSSQRFNRRRDVLSAVLSDGNTYTVKEAQQLIEKYMKGKVR